MPVFSSLSAATKYHSAALRRAPLSSLRKAACAYNMAVGGSSALNGPIIILCRGQNGRYTYAGCSLHQPSLSLERRAQEVFPGDTCFPPNRIYKCPILGKCRCLKWDCLSRLRPSQGSNSMVGMQGQGRGGRGQQRKDILDPHLAIEDFTKETRHTEPPLPSFRNVSHIEMASL